MMYSLDTALSALVGSRVTVLPADIPRDAGQAPVLLTFSTGAVLTAVYWRIIENRMAGTSSFDHKQIYGLPAAINAIDVLRDAVVDRELTSASLDHSTGDLLFRFPDDLMLQVFNFTGYEIWDMWFPDGTVEYSNYNK
jgi:hypothetical protein